MPRLRHTVEQILAKLREVEVALSKGQPSRRRAVRSASRNTLRDELFDRELFDTLWDVKVLGERWRQIDNQIRPHSA